MKQCDLIDIKDTNCPMLRVDMFVWDRINDLQIEYVEPDSDAIYYQFNALMVGSGKYGFIEDGLYIRCAAIQGEVRYKLIREIEEGDS